MKVFVVSVWVDEEYKEMVGVFTTATKADEIGANRGIAYEVDEFELDGE
jgi:hypothetical protein